MEEYVSNSNRSKEQKEKENLLPEKRVEKVVVGAAKLRKKSGVQKLRDIFIAEDVSSVKDYIFMDVLVPSVKKAIDDIVSEGIHMLLYKGDPRRGGSRPSASKINYGSFSRRDGDRRESVRETASRNNFDYNDIIFDTRGDAESVLDSMNDVIDQYGVVSVGDLYDLSDVSIDNYMANKYGWTDLTRAEVVRVRDGYIIKLPRALPIK